MPSFPFLEFSVCNLHFTLLGKVEKQLPIGICVFVIGEFSIIFTNMFLEVSKYYKDIMFCLTSIYYIEETRLLTISWKNKLCAASKPSFKTDSTRHYHPCHKNLVSYNCRTLLKLLRFNYFLLCTPLCYIVKLVVYIVRLVTIIFRFYIKFFIIVFR